ncbi:MAG: hypothetical protein AAF550_08705, partial [Myxococcota bacterium]
AAKLSGSSRFILCNNAHVRKTLGGVSQVITFSTVLGVRAEGATPPEDQRLSRPELVVVLDADDDNEDGQFDALQDQNIPIEDLTELRVAPHTSVRVSGGVRLVHLGHPVETFRSDALDQMVHIQGLQLGAAEVILTNQVREERIRVRVVEVRFLNHHGAPLEATHQALSVSLDLPNGPTLPRQGMTEPSAPDRRSLQIEVVDPLRIEEVAEVVFSSSAVGMPPILRDTIDRVRLFRVPETPRFRSNWLRLVGDSLDRTSEGVPDQLLRVRLRDKVTASYGTAKQSLRVGRPGDESGPLAARRAHLRVVILKRRDANTPVVGSSVATALEIGRSQISIANEIWLQCSISFGPPSEAEVLIAPEPALTLLTVAEGDGLWARGDGSVQLMIDDVALGPVPTAPFARPLETALQIAAAIEVQGYRTSTFRNPPTSFGASGSADVLVYRPDGSPATVTTLGHLNASTDSQQRVSLTKVDLRDGLSEFDNRTAGVGTAEERALIRGITDHDPSTIDVILVNRFTGGTRQGEAFLESDRNDLINAVILDRLGIERQRSAYTQAHEIGHVLLDSGWHPDNYGPDRPWLLMDSNSNAASIRGPKRLTEAECAKARRGTPRTPLLTPMDARRRTPEQPMEHYPYRYGRLPGPPGEATARSTDAH